MAVRKGMRWQIVIEMSMDGASGAPDGTDRGDTGGSQDSGDYEAAMGNVLGAALTCQLRQPQIYKSARHGQAPDLHPCL